LAGDKGADSATGAAVLTSGDWAQAEIDTLSIARKPDFIHENDMICIQKDSIHYARPLTPWEVAIIGRGLS
jgi:hypothetical protein